MCGTLHSNTLKENKSYLNGRWTVYITQSRWLLYHLLLSWSTVVLVPKGSGNNLSIGLLEIVWKTIESIINRRIAQKITFHDSLHGFVAEKGTGTAYVNNWRRWFRKPCILSF